MTAQLFDTLIAAARNADTYIDAHPDVFQQTVYNENVATALFLETDDDSNRYALQMFLTLVDPASDAAIYRGFDPKMAINAVIEVTSLLPHMPAGSTFGAYIEQAALEQPPQKAISDYDLVATVAGGAVPAYAVLEPALA